MVLFGKSAKKFWVFVVMTLLGCAKYGEVDFGSGFYAYVEIKNFFPEIVVEAKGFSNIALYDGFYLEIDRENRVSIVRRFKDGGIEESIYFIYDICDRQLLRIYVDKYGFAKESVVVEKSGGEKIYPVDYGAKYIGLKHIKEINFAFDEINGCYESL